MVERAEDLFNQITAGGSAHILEMIRNQQSEELFLDYKRSADDGTGAKLHADDRQNFGRAISGFGNSEGGVIIWGVNCKSDPVRGDLPDTPRPILNASRFRSWLEQEVSGRTVPPHGAVLNRSILLPNATDGFVVSLIPKGVHAPYQVVPDLKYLMRAGSNFAPVPHAVLAGLFGRRPQPDIHCKTVLGRPIRTANRFVEFDVSMLMQNFGQGIAEDLFCNSAVVLQSGGQPNVVITFGDVDSAVWDGQLSFKSIMSVIARPGRRLAPQAHIIAISIHFKIKPPFTENIVIDGSFGATGAPLGKIGFSIAPAALQHAWDLVDKTDPSSPTYEYAQEQALDALFPGVK